METKKEKSRVVGGIFRTQPNSTNPQPIRYAVVLGRRSGMWSFPKGHSKRGETLEETAQREIEEEIGWKILPPVVGHRRVASVRYFLYDVAECFPLFVGDTREIQDARWMTKEELQTVPVNRGIAEYLKLGKPQAI